MHLLKGILYLLAAVVFVVFVIRHIESRSIFFPMKGAPPVPTNALPHEDVFFEAADGTKLHGWFVPGDPKAPVVLFLHGNAGNIGHRWEKIHILHAIGVSVFIVDYRGYGRSEGRPSEKGIYKDADAAYAYLTGRGATAEAIVPYGESIGGAFAIDLASRKPVRALIVEDTFTSVPAMVRRSLPFIPAFCLATRLDSLPKIMRIKAPKLVFHSADDEIVPFEMGEALFQAAPEPKRFVRLRGGHNTAFFDDLSTYRRGLAGFLHENHDHAF